MASWRNRSARERQLSGHEDSATGEVTSPQAQYTSLCVPCQFTYVIPNPNRSEGEARRYDHLDLPEMTDRDLWREWERVKAALWCCEDDRAMPWLQARIEAVRRERRRRNG